MNSEQLTIDKVAEKVRELLLTQRDNPNVFSTMTIYGVPDEEMAKIFSAKGDFINISIHPIPVEMVTAAGEPVSALDHSKSLGGTYFDPRE